MKKYIGCLRIFLIYILSCMGVGSIAQKQAQVKIDSLLSVLQTAKADTNKVNNFLNVANILRNINPDSSFNFCIQALALSTDLKWEIGIGKSNSLIGLCYGIKGDNQKALDYGFTSLAIWQKLEKKLSANSHSPSSEAERIYLLKLKSRSLGNIGIAYDDLGEYSKALQYYFEALNIGEELRDNVVIGNQIGNIGIVYKRQGDYPKALEYYFKALKIGEQTGDKGRIARQLTGIGNVYLEYQQTNGLRSKDNIKDSSYVVKALEYYIKALKMAEEIGSKEGMAINMGNLGVAYSIEGNYSKSLEYYFKALKMAENLGSKQGVVNHLGNIGNTYFLLDDTLKALESYEKALKIANEIGDKRSISINTNNIGNIYLNQNKILESREYFNKSLELSRQIGDKNSIKLNYSNLASLDSIQNNFKSAFQNYKMFISYKDSIFNNEKTKEITQKEMNYEFDKKEAATKADQEKKDLLAKAEYDKQIAVAEADKLRGIAEADKKRALLELNKNIELAAADKKFTQAEANKKVAIAEADKKRVIAEADRKNIKIASEKQITDAKLESEKQKLLRNSIAGGASVIILLSLFIFFFYKRKRDADQKQKETALSLQVSETEMKALRSQMNPHFIFNALQSIQTFLMSHQPDDANTYLLKFSKLMRLVLENSQHSEVSLKEDMQALELYMQLESIRLLHPFTYQFHIDENIDMDETTIPPLILQPFVENAIWHGLQNKPEPGNIDISISKRDNGLYAIVEDNGVGRDMIKKNVQPLLIKRESMGMKLTEERLKILNELKNIKAEFKIIDLFNADNQPAGTRVELFLPFAA